jgi:hypothetical protein
LHGNVALKNVPGMLGAEVLVVGLELYLKVGDGMKG